ncbi:hypothetical protein [Selenomonas ruminantium]|uniref:Uncharacterized protein n=1 Tax=Selenomonas ruminantium TaxID=971 RepID=A0A1K1N4R1_SELRU|nr:hypothetical protein [Selenomonas ruminantium]SFW30356.1 hypothetical protein SAMN02910323_1169 [Selenomonas ruminantium]
MEKLMNKMDVMEMDKVSGGSIKLRPRPLPRLPRSVCHDSNANSMAANVDETQMKLPIGKLPIGKLPVAGGHKINV